ncbi:MAG: hypothetical protein Q8927_14345, partial [Bacteroidota bacterium]|nr:hypothetical protein [Bacteroidota bacterium]
MKRLFIALFALAGLRAAAMDKSSDTSRQPAFILADTTVGAMTLLTIRDTATGMADISQIMGRDYGELFAFVGQNGLKPGRTMAFY